MIKKKRTGKIEIDLTGPQGNAFFLLGTAQRLCREMGKDVEKITEEMKESDYEHLLEVFEREFGKFVIMYR
jgi:hypothetical protein